MVAGVLEVHPPSAPSTSVTEDVLTHISAVGFVAVDLKPVPFSRAVVAVINSLESVVA